MRVCQPSPQVLEHTLHGDHSSAAGSPRGPDLQRHRLALRLCGQDCRQAPRRTPQEEGRGAVQLVVAARPFNPAIPLQGYGAGLMPALGPWGLALHRTLCLALVALKPFGLERRAWHPRRYSLITKVIPYN